MNVLLNIFKAMRLIFIWACLLSSQFVFGSDPPFGSLSAPVNGSTVSSSIAVTGWALDDVEVTSLKVYRNSISGEGGGLIYIGDAVFVEGIRPDIEAAFPEYPNNSSAGWGYMLLTNYLPDGTYTLYAIATDGEGNQATIGSVAITIDNASAVKPFGNIDVPASGGMATGSSYIVWGWALTPQPNTIPTDGSTIKIWVDGVPLGNPIYNIYREDIATQFPGYNNSNGAVFYFYLDTTPYTNGTHTIHAYATDDAGNADGIGSRYFQIFNEVSLPVFISQFSAQQGPGCILLSWITESEVDNLGFILERSDDNRNSWNQVAHHNTHDGLKSQGNTSSQTSYFYQDFTVKPGVYYYYRLADVCTDGIITTLPAITIATDDLYQETKMENAYPNPFNPQTYISYHLKMEMHVEIAVFNSLGQRVQILHGGNQSAGSYQVFWNGLDESGEQMAGGIYFIRMAADEVEQVQKVILLK
ncbi:T9SS type A sorting domain-containing protein [bacterium]|nr:T9SS type A sorting domain-containing protein [bacterium]